MSAEIGVYVKDFWRWNARKAVLDAGAFPSFVHDREIWWCSLGVNVGDEEDGKNEFFERPVLVLKKFNKRIILVVPLTTQIKENVYHHIFTHDGVRYAVILSQLRLISTKRLSRRIRRMDHGLFDAIKECVKKVCF